jgi:hypothetical protein
MHGAAVQFSRAMSGGAAKGVIPKNKKQTVFFLEIVKKGLILQKFALDERG